MLEDEEGGSQRVENFSLHEELQLCRSWMHISQDPIVGAQQKKLKFCERIEDHFKSAMFQNFGVPIQPRKIGIHLSYLFYIYIYIYVYCDNTIFTYLIFGCYANLIYVTLKIFANKLP